MLIDKDNILQLIPQREPFVMIDKLVTATESKFESRFNIESNNIFVENGQISESALVENVAQTCAAGFGYIGSQKGEGAGGLGFIGAVTKLVVHGKAKVGDNLNTIISVLNTFDKIHLIEGHIEISGKKVIECQMKIVVP